LLFRGLRNVSNNRVVLLLRIRLKDGSRSYATPAAAKNSKIIPLAVLVNGKAEHHPEGVYALRYRENGRIIYRQVGTDHDAAQTARLRLELELRTRCEPPEVKAVRTTPFPVQAPAQPVQTGTSPAPPHPVMATGMPVPPQQAAANTVASAFTARFGTTSITPLSPALHRRGDRSLEPLTLLRDSFIGKHAHGSSDTVYAYTYVATEFVSLLEQCGKSTPVQIDEEDVLAFDRLLESKGNFKSTRASRYGYVRCFLRYCGLNPSRSDDDDAATGVMSGAAHRKLKSKPKLAVETYSEADLQRLYAASSERHRLIWRAFRMLGLRDEELAYTLWSNIDWENRLWMVRFKASGSFPWNRKLEWKSKDSEERDIPIPAVLYDELLIWRAKNPKAHLVFPTSGGKADIKLLKAVKSDWREAGLNCGNCAGCLRSRSECTKAKLKTFRATYLTTMLRHVDLRSVQALAGHSDIATTQKYLSPASQDVLQKAANAAFGTLV
jgi:integrase